MSVPLPWATEWDLMIGLDKHNELCIPPTPPAPPAPSAMHKHVVVATMHWLANSGQWKKRDVFIENRLCCKHFHDISYLIPHIPLPLPGWVLLVAIIPLSSSKIAVGCFSVHANGEPAGVLPLAHNCWSLMPRPSGLIIPTRLPTVWVGVSFTDILYSGLYVGFDMLLSYLLNKMFDKWLKGPLEKWINEALKRVAGKILEAEVEAAISQAVQKVTTEIIKKVAGKLGKAIVKKIGEAVNGWLGRTNPGFEEKYVKVFEAEAAAMFAAYLWDTWTPQIHEAALEILPAALPGIDMSEVRPQPEPAQSRVEFVQTFVETLGPMIKDSVRGLLMSNEWKKFVNQDGSDASSA